MCDGIISFKNLAHVLMVQHVLLVVLLVMKVESKYVFGVIYIVLIEVKQMLLSYVNNLVTEQHNYEGMPNLVPIL